MFRGSSYPIKKILAKIIFPNMPAENTIAQDSESLVLRLQLKKVPDALVSVVEEALEDIKWFKEEHQQKLDYLLKERLGIVRMFHFRPGGVLFRASFPGAMLFQ